MKRTMGLAVAAALLAGCGGSGGAAGAAGSLGGDYKSKMGDAMKPCVEAVKEATALVGSFKSRKASQGEAAHAADAAAAACEASHAAWAALDMPAPVAEACMTEAQARLDTAYATRAALDHGVSAAYKQRMDRSADRAKRYEAACKKAKG